MPVSKINLGLRIIAAFKLVTAFLLVCISFGVFRLMGTDIGETLENFVLRLHLDPERHWINMALVSVAGVNPASMKVIGVGSLFYALLYVMEGIGLWLGKRWAEYLVVIITGSLLPLEIYEVAIKVGLIRVAVLAVNLAIIAYLINQIKRGRHRLP